LVRAAGAGGAVFDGGRELVAPSCSVISAPIPDRDLEQRLDEASWEGRAAAMKPGKVKLSQPPGVGKQAVRCPLPVNHWLPGRGVRHEERQSGRGPRGGVQALNCWRARANLLRLHRLMYRIEDEKIRILRVIHGRRLLKNVPGNFEEPGQETYQAA
jgi:hypothetical protein